MGAAGQSAEKLGLKVAGALSGTVFVDSLDSKVGQLREEVARLLGHDSCTGIKLIVGGRSLQDDGKSLQECNVNRNSRVLVVAGAQAGGDLQRMEARQTRLEKIRRVLTNLASRNANQDDHFSLELENQSGERLQLTPEDKKALVMGLALHDMGKKAMAKGDYEQALSMLLMSEESFGLANPDLVSSIDNLGLLLLDIVWCCYKAGDIRRLAVARDRLGRARQALENAYGPGLVRLRQLHGSRCPERAIYTRLEALEAVSAYQAVDIDAAEKALQSAQARWNALQVSDQSLAYLQDMGYDPAEARRALKMSDGSIDAALTFIASQRAVQQEREERKNREDRWRRERKKYGKTISGSYLDQETLEQVSSMGYGKELSALALRIHDNKEQATLEGLLDEQTRSLYVTLLSVMQERQQHSDRHMDNGASSSSGPSRNTPNPARLLTADAASELATLLASLREVPMTVGYEEEVLVRIQSAVDGIVSPRHKRRAEHKEPAAATTASTSQQRGAGEGEGSASGSVGSHATSSQMDVNGHNTRAAATAAGGSTQTDEHIREAAEVDEYEGSQGAQGSPTHASDAEMEDEVRGAIGDNDVMASYDLDVREEGEIIIMYAAMCASARAAGQHH